jgi:hypothetical protein
MAFMHVQLIEATNGFNWGKFLVMKLDAEWSIESQVDPGRPLLRARGWRDRLRIVFDIETGEGASFYVQPNGHAASDLHKHQIWVCPLFEPFLIWLYRQEDLDNLPKLVDLNAPGEMYGYRRGGPQAGVVIQTKK